MQSSTLSTKKIMLPGGILLHWAKRLFEWLYLSRYW